MFNFKINIIFFLMILLSVFSVFSQDKENEFKKEKTEGEITETKIIPISDKSMELKLGFYGFLKTDYVYANHSVLSYGRENLVAPNQAKRHVQRNDNQPTSSIQLADTRLGFKAEYGNLLNGIIEMDFIDFDKSTPNVNVRPRLRQAYINAKLTNNVELFTGQKWDIFSPLNPETYNIINSLFYSGNVGWIREQFGVTYKLNPELQFSTALGNSSVNTSASPSISVEKNKNPTLAGQMKWTPNEQNTIFVSGIYTNRSYHDPALDPAYYDGKPLVYDGSSDSFLLVSEIGKSNRIRRDATGLSAGSEMKLSNSKFRVKWEINWGRNLSDLNTLGIGQAQVTTNDNSFLSSPQSVFIQSESGGLLNDTYSHSLRKYNQNRTEVKSIEERGAWLSLIYKIDPKWEVGVLLGVTKIKNQKDLSPAFSDSKKGILRDFSKAQGDPTNGIWTANHLGRVRENSEFGYHITYMFADRLKIFFQHEYIRTFYQDPDSRKNAFAHIKSFDISTGNIQLQEVKFPYQYSSAVANAHVLRIGTMFAF